MSIFLGFVGGREPEARVQVMLSREGGALEPTGSEVWHRENGRRVREQVRGRDADPDMSSGPDMCFSTRSTIFSLT